MAADNEMTAFVLWDDQDALVSSAVGLALAAALRCYGLNSRSCRDSATCQLWKSPPSQLRYLLNY